MSEENGTTSSEIKTPIGSISFSGKCVAEFIAILSLCLLFLGAYVLWEHKLDAKVSQQDVRDDKMALLRRHWG